MNVNVLTNISGYPNGTAAAKRVKMIGKALIEAGLKFSVYTNTLTPNIFNQHSSGSFDGIYFEYLHGDTALNGGKIRKLFLYIKGVVGLINVLRKKDPLQDIVYIDAQGRIFNVIALIFCKLFGLKVFQEVNEWYHNDLKMPLQKIINEGPMLKWSHGALVISKNINNNVLSVNPKIKTVVVPVLDDPSTYACNNEMKATNEYCFWMGEVDGYIEDVLFIIQSLGIAYNQGNNYDLVISGPCRSNVTRNTILNKAVEVGYPIDKIKLMGYISEEDLDSYCKNAAFFVVPLWRSERSASRFPTKIASFMFSGKPILTCNIGEVGSLLTDRENVVFYEPGNSQDLAKKVQNLASDKPLYNSICSNTKTFAMKNFNYREHSSPLKDFCTALLRA